MNAFKNKVCIVTGAASGIGYALCRELCKHGAKVYAADLNEAGLENLKKECNNYNLHIHQLDVTNECAVSSLLNNVAYANGWLDYLFNNAGIVIGGNFEKMNLKNWKNIIDINLYGVIHGTQNGYALMLKQRNGHIINTASTAGLTPVANSTAYATTKHAVVGLSTSLREEARKYGIRVSVVIPGLVDTNIFTSATNLRGYDYDANIKRLPIRKISPEQAANAILHGVIRNQAYIIFPAYNRLIVFLYRLLPSFVGRLINQQINT